MLDGLDVNWETRRNILACSHYLVLLAFGVIDYRKVEGIGSCSLVVCILGSLTYAPAGSQWFLACSVRLVGTADAVVGTLKCLPNCL